MSDIRMEDIVKEAMFRALDQGKRDELIKKAIEHVITPRDVYGKRTNPLQEAFNDEASRLVQKLVSEFLTGNDPAAEKVRAQLREVVVAGWEKAMSSPSLADKIGDAIVYAVLTER